MPASPTGCSRCRISTSPCLWPRTWRALPPPCRRGRSCPVRRISTEVAVPAGLLTDARSKIVSSWPVPGTARSPHCRTPWGGKSRPPSRTHNRPGKLPFAITLHHRVDAANFCLAARSAGFMQPQNVAISSRMQHSHVFAHTSKISRTPKPVVYLHMLTVSRAFVAEFPQNSHKAL